MTACDCCSDVISVDPHLQVGVKAGVVDDEIPPHEMATAGLSGELRQRERRVTSRRGDGHDLFIDGQAAPAPIVHEQQPIASSLNGKRAGERDQDHAHERDRHGALPQLEARERSGVGCTGEKAAHFLPLRLRQSVLRRGAKDGLSR
jgi:hypothetical protein